MGGWIPVAERLPEVGNKVLAYYINELKNGRIVIAEYVPPKTILSEDFFDYDYDGLDEYDEDNDCFWVIPGWWEGSLEAEKIWLIASEILYWQELPEPPEVTA
jgi:hypothetical protein